MGWSVKYDVRDVEPGQDFDTPFPAGIYVMEIESATKKQSKSSDEPMLELVLKVVKGEHKGRKVWDYIVLNENSDWRMKQLVDALGEKGKGTLSENKVVGSKIKANIKIEGSKDDEYGESNKVKSYVAKKKADEQAEADEEAEADGTAEDAEAEAEGEESGEEEWTYDDLVKMDKAEIKEWYDENGAEFELVKGMSIEDVALGLAEEFELKGIPGQEDEEAEGEDGEVDYDSMTVAELKEAAEGLGVSPKGTKKALLKKVKKAAAEQTDGGGEDEASGETDDDPF